jgi:type IV secretory pathway TraG/TraD family ATPase VirD4
VDPSNSITFLATTNYRGIRQPFGIKRDDRRQHMYMIGKTGMGKSTLLDHMIAQDIQGGEGLALVDPHGDLVERILRFVPSRRINDVVYVNPSDLDYPVAFNPLEAVDPATAAPCCLRADRRLQEALRGDVGASPRVHPPQHCAGASGVRARDGARHPSDVRGR